MDELRVCCKTYAPWRAASLDRSSGPSYVVPSGRDVRHTTHDHERVLVSARPPGGRRTGGAPHSTPLRCTLHELRLGHVNMNSKPSCAPSVGPCAGR